MGNLIVVIKVGKPWLICLILFLRLLQLFMYHAYYNISFVKLWFTKMLFVSFYSVPNLIVILFNLLYPIFVVGFDCKGCVLERESLKTQAIEARRSLASISRLSFLRSEAYALHITRMRRVSIGWRQLWLASISRVSPSGKTPTRHSIMPVCTIWYTFYVPTLYIPILPTNVKECFWRKP